DIKETITIDVNGGFAAIVLKDVQRVGSELPTEEARLRACAHRQRKSQGHRLDAKFLNHVLPPLSDGMGSNESSPIRYNLTRDILSNSRATRRKVILFMMLQNLAGVRQE